MYITYLFYFILLYFIFMQRPVNYVPMNDFNKDINKEFRMKTA